MTGKTLLKLHREGGPSYTEAFLLYKNYFFYFMAFSQGGTLTLIFLTIPQWGRRLGQWGVRRRRLPVRGSRSKPLANGGIAISLFRWINDVITKYLQRLFLETKTFLVK